MAVIFWLIFGYSEFSFSIPSEFALIKLWISWFFPGIFDEGLSSRLFKLISGFLRFRLPAKLLLFCWELEIDALFVGFFNGNSGGSDDEEKLSLTCFGLGYEDSGLGIISGLFSFILELEPCMLSGIIALCGIFF